MTTPIYVKLDINQFPHRIQFRRQKEEEKRINAVLMDFIFICKNRFIRL